MNRPLTDLPLHDVLPDDGSRRLFAVFEKLGAARWAMEVNDEGRAVTMRWSPEIRRLAGYDGDAAGFPDALPFVFSILHPDDIAPIRRALWAALSDATGRTNYDVVYRIRNAEGVYHWFRAVGRHAPGRTKNGNHLFYGLLLRHDSEKAAQDELEARRTALERMNESLLAQTKELEALRRKEAEDLARIRSLHAALEADRTRLVRRMRVIEALSRDCTTVWVVHVPAMTLTLVRNNGITEKLPAISSAAETNNLEAGLRLYAERCVHPEDRERFLKAMAYETIRREITSRPVYQFVYRRLIGGVTSWYEAVLSLTNPGVNEDFVAGFRSADAAVARNENEKAELKAALLAAQRASAERTKFLNAISHDIRTPMNAIVGMTALASAHLADPERLKDSLGKITGAGRELLSLINHVLDLSRLESGKLALTKEPVSLPALFDALAARLLPLANEKSIVLSAAAKGVRHESLTGDPVRLLEILLNLAENAVKFTPAQGRVTLTLTETGSSQGEAAYRFDCADTGIGMTAAFQERLFSPFARADAADNAQGAGLGLAVARRLLSLMAGDITVESRPNEGSVFSATFRLPVREAPPEAPEALRGKRVLLVDENADESSGALRTLQDLGVKALQAESMEAAQRLWTASGPFDLCLADGRLPNGAFAETVLRLRAMTGSETPVVLFGAEAAASEERAAAQAAGAAGFMKKPLFRSTLQEGLLGALAKTALLDARAPSAAAAPEAPAPARRPRRALLAEDNELNREIALELLTSLGLSVEAAPNGREALALYQSQPAGWFDVIFMDLEMPVMNGLEAARAIRRSRRSDAETTPLVAMSASTRTEDREAAREAGLSEWLEKPADRLALAALLASLSLTGEAS